MEPKQSDQKCKTLFLLANKTLLTVQSQGIALAQTQDICLVQTQDIVRVQKQEVAPVRTHCWCSKQDVVPVQTNTLLLLKSENGYCSKQTHCASSSTGPMLSLKTRTLLSTKQDLVLAQTRREHARHVGEILFSRIA